MALTSNYIRWANYIPTFGPAAGIQDLKIKKKALNERLRTNYTKVTYICMYEDQLH